VTLLARADRRLVLRLALGLAAVILLGVPFLLLALLVRATWSPLFDLDTSVAGRRLALWTLVTVWGAALLGLLLKVLVGRARPDLIDAVATAPGRSFPSGHALTSTVGCAVLLLLVSPLLRRPWRGIAIAVAVLIPLVVGFARIGLGVHFLSDVVAGQLLGLGWVAVTAAAFEAWRRDVGLPPSPPTEAEPELGQNVPEPSSG
jgi:membrane-associated phospholipid phosphatase